MKTKYDFDSRPPVIDLDKIAKRKDCDILFKFGGAEMVIQYRLENARRIGHPFIDIVTVPYIDEPLCVDLCDKDGGPVYENTSRMSHKPIYQILLGQKVSGK